MLFNACEFSLFFQMDSCHVNMQCVYCESVSAREGIHQDPQGWYDFFAASENPLIWEHAEKLICLCRCSV